MVGDLVANARIKILSQTLQSVYQQLRDIPKEDLTTAEGNILRILLRVDSQFTERGLGGFLKRENA